MAKIEFSSLKGMIFTNIEGMLKNSNKVTFTRDDGSKLYMYHDQNCCEGVDINDVIGDVDDLLNTPILAAEESISNENPHGVEIPEYQDSFTWTFYRFRTLKGSLTLRWYGSSNGYYSESVDVYNSLCPWDDD